MSNPSTNLDEPIVTERTTHRYVMGNRCSDLHSVSKDRVETILWHITNAFEQQLTPSLDKKNLFRRVSRFTIGYGTEEERIEVTIANAVATATDLDIAEAARVLVEEGGWFDVTLLRAAKEPDAVACVFYRYPGDSITRRKLAVESTDKNFNGIHEYQRNALVVEGLLLPKTESKSTVSRDTLQEIPSTAKKKSWFSL